MVAQHVSVQLEDVSDEPVVGSKCLPSTSLHTLRLKGVVFVAARKPRVLPRSWAEYVDQLGKIDNRPLQQVDTKHKAPYSVRHADGFFLCDQEVAG